MLLDIEMPRMDGFEVATRVRASQDLKHIPIVMITSRTGDKHRQRAMELGVDQYMGKPYQEEQLLETLNQLLNRRELISTYAAPKSKKDLAARRVHGWAAGRETIFVQRACHQ